MTRAQSSGPALFKMDRSASKLFGVRQVSSYWSIAQPNSASHWSVRGPHHGLCPPLQPRPLRLVPAEVRHQADLAGHVGQLCGRRPHRRLRGHRDGSQGRAVNVQCLSILISTAARLSVDTDTVNQAPYDSLECRRPGRRPMCPVNSVTS